MIFIVVSQEDRLVKVEKAFDSLENAKNYVDSQRFSRKIDLEWQFISGIWFKSYKTPGSRVVFGIYEMEINV